MGPGQLLLAVQTIQGPTGEENKKVQEDRKSILWRRTSTILNGGQKRTLLGGPKERLVRNAFQKAMMAFRKVGFRTYQSEKGAGKDCTQNKGKGKDQKGKCKEKLILNPDFQPLKHSMKKDMAILWNRTTCLPAIGLTIP